MNAFTRGRYPIFVIRYPPPPRPESCILHPIRPRSWRGSGPADSEPGAYDGRYGLEHEEASEGLRVEVAPRRRSCRLAKEDVDEHPRHDGEGTHRHAVENGRRIDPCAD